MLGVGPWYQLFARPLDVALANFLKTLPSEQARVETAVETSGGEGSRWWKKSGCPREFYPPSSFQEACV